MIGPHDDQSAALKQRCPDGLDLNVKRKAWLALQLLGESFQGSAAESCRAIQFAHLFFCLVGKKTQVEGIFHSPPCQASLVSSTPIMMEMGDLR